MKLPARSAIAASLVMILLCVGATGARADSVAILYRQATPQATYAANKLQAALSERGVTVEHSRITDGREITLSVDSAHLKPEEFAIVPQGKTIAVTGGDNRGMIYGALALA